MYNRHYTFGSAIYLHLLADCMIGQRSCNEMCTLIVIFVQLGINFVIIITIVLNIVIIIITFVLIVTMNSVIIHIATVTIRIIV